MTDVTVENSKVKDLCRKLICVVIAVLAPDQHDPAGLLKMDCEGAEIDLLRSLRAARLLAGVGLIVGEWHALDARASTTAEVRRQLLEVLQHTHDVEFRSPFRGREGHFTARPLVRR